MLRCVAPEPGNRRLLDELDVPPRGGADRTCVVVREPAPVEAVFRNAVPFLASHFAGFAPNAQGRVGKKCGDAHALVPVNELS